MPLLSAMLSGHTLLLSLSTILTLQGPSPADAEGSSDDTKDEGAGSAAAPSTAAETSAGETSPAVTATPEKVASGSVGAAQQAAPTGPSTAEMDALGARLDNLADENEELREEIEFLQEDFAWHETQINRLSKVETRVRGYVDVGFFKIFGGELDANSLIYGPGSGLAVDQNKEFYPDVGVPGSWVFIGDPYSVMINSRGDVAETWDSLAVPFDPVNNDGKSSFMLNNVNLWLFSGFGNFTVDAMVDFLPRTRDVTVNTPEGVPQGRGLFIGDYVDVKLGYARYTVPSKKFDLNIYAGKFDAVAGYEYRIQETPDRLTVTPSLICRYVCGRPTGIKTRWKFLPKRGLIFNFSITNGGTFWEKFGFFGDVDTNEMKTFTGRLSYKLPFPNWGFEFAGSGFWGAQDFQPENDATHWQLGADLHGEVFNNRIDIQAEYVQGVAEGLPTDDTVTDNSPLSPEPGACGLAPCLEYRGAYGLVGVHVTNWLTPFARVDWRDADHRKGGTFVYITETMRVTGGVRFDIGTNFIVKAEYTYNRELNKAVPANRRQFDNDILTTSFTATF